MTAEQDLVFLFDVDNTLLDNDRVTEDLRRHLIEQFGKKSAERYWVMLDTLRVELGYTDYLGALQRYRQGLMNDPYLLGMSAFLLEYPFADRLYPGALAVLDHVRQWGTTVILSDGDVVFQPRKIQRSGLWDAVQGRVLIYIHKEKMIDSVIERYPARHYVVIDDKMRILAALKKRLGDKLTTVFPRQGHYAHDLKAIRSFPPADIVIEHIGDLARFDLSAFSRAASADAHTERGTT
jgi:FMN phosphatase YigB (HAD superfamily)